MTDVCRDSLRRDADAERCDPPRVVSCEFCRLDGGVTCTRCGAVLGCHLKPTPVTCPDCWEEQRP